MKNKILFILLITIVLKGTAQTSFQHSIGTFAEEEGRIIKQTHDGGFIISGISGYINSMIIKTDSTGNQLWVRLINNTDVRDVLETSNGEYVLIGLPAFLIKLDANGNQIWDYNYYSSPMLFEFKTVTEALDHSGYIISGGYDHNGIIKLDTSGIFKWSRTIVPNDPSYYGFSSFCASQSSDSSLYVLGSTRQGANEIIILNKFKSNGAPVWSKIVSSSGMMNSWPIRDLKSWKRMIIM